jgi:hypothetical protein
MQRGQASSGQFVAQCSWCSLKLPKKVDAAYSTPGTGEVGVTFPEQQCDLRCTQSTQLLRN